MKQGYKVTGLDRSGTRRTITTTPDRKQALERAKAAKARGVTGVRIEIFGSDPRLDEMSRSAQRREAVQKAQRKGKIG